MKRVKSLMFVGLSTIVLSACTSSSDDLEQSFLEDIEEAISEETTFNTKTVNNLFSLEVPDYMSEQDLGNEDASLQMGNLYKEVYLLAIEESKTSLDAVGLEFDVESYTEFAVEFAKNAFITSSENKVTLEPKEVNGAKMMTYDLEGTMEGIPDDIYYSINIFETETYFYNVSYWCYAKDKETYKTDLEKTIKSFKQL